MKMLTLKMIESSCDAVGECLLWRHGCNDSDMPMAQHAGKVVSVRRLVLSFKGVDVPAGKLVAVTCREPRCLAFKHLAVITRKELQQALAAEGAFSRPDAKARRIIGRRNGAGVKLKGGMQSAREIRDVAGKEPQEVTAKRMGISVSMVSKIQLGIWWKELPGASVFSMGVA